MTLPARLIAGVLLGAVALGAHADPPPGKGWNKGAGNDRDKGRGGAVMVVPQPGTIVVVPQGGPPPWAPAHGYRRKAGAAVSVYQPPFGIGAGTCQRELIGSLLGAAAGGALGSRIGDGSGRLAATAAGTLAGFLFGGAIGRDIDATDIACMGQVLEYAPENRLVTWNAPDGDQYRMTPTRTWQAGDAYCREYQTVVTIGGAPRQAFGKACRQPDGSWRTVD